MCVVCKNMETEKVLLLFNFVILVGFAFVERQEFSRLLFISVSCGANEFEDRLFCSDKSPLLQQKRVCCGDCI